MKQKMRNLSRSGVRSMVFACILGLLPALSSAAMSDVVSINWSRFNRGQPQDTLSKMARTLSLNLIKYSFNYYLDSLDTDSTGLHDFTSYSFGEVENVGIYKPACISIGLGTALAFGFYDSVVTGRGSAQARAVLHKLIKGTAKAHVSNGGYVVSSATAREWEWYTAMAAWLHWTECDSLEKALVVRMVEGEAARCMAERADYCNDCTDNTGAEENGMRARILHLAATLMPAHANAPLWRSKGTEFMLAASARRSDLAKQTPVDGRLFSDWVDGWNVREPGYVYNHGILHPDYSTFPLSNLLLYVSGSLAGRTVSQAAMNGVANTYGFFVNYKFPGNRTVYQPGNPLLYYPQGTDWCPELLYANVLFDVFAAVFPEIDVNDSVGAFEWARLRLSYLETKQARLGTGEVYAAGEWREVSANPNGSTESNWIMAETWMLAYLSNVCLILWLDHNRAIARAGNWNLGIMDTTAASVPVGLSGLADGAHAASLTWRHSTDAESGIFGYRVFRDGRDLGLATDTLFRDTGLQENVVYRYTVKCLNRYGIESDTGAGVSVKTPADHVPPRALYAVAAGPSSIRIFFSESLDSTTAVDTARYSFSGRRITSALPGLDQRSVTLTLPDLALGDSGGLTMTGLKDASAAANMAPAEILGFKYDSLGMGLAGYWSFDNGVPGVAKDFSGQGRDGVIHGAEPCAGVSGQGLRFQGPDHVDMGSILDSFKPPFSFSLWIRWAGDTTCGLIYTEDHPSHYYGALLSLTKTGLVSTMMGNGGLPSPGSRKSKVSASAVSRNVWTHVAAVFRDFSSITIYINGLNTGGSMSGDATFMKNNFAKRFKLGLWSLTNTAGGPYQYIGDMDEVRVYDRALSAGDVAALAGVSGAAGDTPVSSDESVSFTAQPNPFNPSVCFSIQTGNFRQGAALSVFDLQGRLIRKFLAKRSGENPGGIQIVWDGRDSFDRPLSSGVYFARAVSGCQTMNLRVLLQK